MKRLTLDIDDQKHAQLKSKTASAGVSMRDILDAAIDDISLWQVAAQVGEVERQGASMTDNWNVLGSDDHGHTIDGSGRLVNDDGSEPHAMIEFTYTVKRGQDQPRGIPVSWYVHQTDPAGFAVIICNTTLKHYAEMIAAGH